MPPIFCDHLRCRFQVELGEGEGHAGIQVFYGIALKITLEQSRHRCNIAGNAGDQILKQEKVNLPAFIHGSNARHNN